MEHRDDGDGFSLFDKEKIVMVAMMRFHTVDGRHGFSADGAGGDSLAAVMEIVLIPVGLRLALCLPRVQPDID